MGRLFGWGGRPPCRPRALENHITIHEAPKADNPARRSRIGSGPRLCIKLGMCGGLSQSTLSSLSYRSLTVTFYRKSLSIISGRLFLSISPITGLGLCELRELCELPRSRTEPVRWRQRSVVRLLEHRASYYQSLTTEGCRQRTGSERLQSI